MIRAEFSEEASTSTQINGLDVEHERGNTVEDTVLLPKVSANYEADTFEEEPDYKEGTKFTDRFKKHHLSKAETILKRYKPFKPRTIVEEYDMVAVEGGYRERKLLSGIDDKENYGEFLSKLGEIYSKNINRPNYTGLTLDEITLAAGVILSRLEGHNLQREIWVYRTAFYRDFKVSDTANLAYLREEYEISRALKHHRKDNNAKVATLRSSELYIDGVRGYRETRRLMELYELRGSPGRSAYSAYQPDIQELLKYVRAFRNAPIWVISAAMDAGVDLHRPPSEERLFTMAKAWKFSPVMWENVAERVGKMGLWQRMVAGSIMGEMAREKGVRIRYPSRDGYYGNTITCEFSEHNQEGIATWYTDKSLREEFWQRFKQALDKGRDQALTEHAKDFKGNRRRVASVRFDRARLSKEQISELVENASVASLASLNVGHFKAALDYLHAKGKELDANADVNWCTTSALGLVNTFGAQWKQKLEESSGLFSPQSFRDTLVAEDEAFEVITTFSKPQFREWLLSIGNDEFTVKINQAGKVTDVPNKIKELLGDKWRNKLGSLTLADNPKSYKIPFENDEITLNFNPPTQEVWKVKIEAPNNSALMNNRPDGLIAEGEATIDRNGKIISISDNCKQASLRWQVDGRQLVTDFKFQHDSIENRSYHDATYWLPKQVCGADLKGLDVFLNKFKNRDVQELSTIASSWHRLSDEERTLPYKDVLAAIRSRSYDGVECKEFAEEAAYWGVGEKQYKNLENLYKQSQSVPEPFDSSKRWEKNGLVGRFLPRSDPRVGFFGKHTNCCQHLLKDAGTACAVSTMSDPFSQLFVIEKEGKIIAGSWVWQTPTSFADAADKTKLRNYNTVCFDNIEALTLSDVQQKTILEIYHKTANHLAEAGARKVTVGNGMSDVNLHTLADTDNLSLPREYSGYTDASSQKLLAENKDAPPLGMKNIEKIWVRGALEKDLEKAEKVAKAVYPQGHDHVSMPEGDDPRGMVLMDATEGVIGYAVWSDANKEITDIAVMPTKDNGKGGKTQDPKHSLKLIRAVMDMCHEKGGTWKAEARESTTYRLLKSMEANGKITLNDKGISHYIGKEPVYSVEFSPLRRARNGAVEADVTPQPAPTLNDNHSGPRRLDSLTIDGKEVYRVDGQLVSEEVYRQRPEPGKLWHQFGARVKPYHNYWGRHNAQPEEPMAKVEGHDSKPNVMVYESHPAGRVNDVLAEKLRDALSM